MATVRCWWHKRFFPQEEVPCLIVFGADNEGDLNAICPKCRQKVIEEVKDEDPDPSG